MITISFSKAILETLSGVLGKAAGSNNFRLFKITQSLIWLGENKPPAEIAEFFKVSVRTIYNWFWEFADKGYSWLNGKHYQGRGRKPKLSKAQQRELSRMITAGPEANGFDCGVWNAAMIAELIAVEFGRIYNSRYLSSLLKKLGFSYQKARFISDRFDEEDFNKKREVWVNETWPRILEEAKEKKAVILFGDEVSFAMWGSLAKTWAPKGKQPLVKTKGVRKGLKMFGAIEFFGGAFHYMESLYYCLTPKSLKLLKKEGFSKERLDRLKKLKHQNFRTKEEFIDALRPALGMSDDAIESLVLKHAATSGRFNGDTYIEFLKQLLIGSSSHIILIEDGASYHRSAVVQEFKEKHKKSLSVFPLPAFSPDYNPIEKLWRNTKRDATHLKYFQTFEQLRDSVIEVFRQYMEDASRIIRVMKKLRAQAGVA